MTPDGEILKEWNSSGFNPFYQDADTIVYLFQKEVFPLLDRIPNKIFFYGAGCVNPVASAPITDCLQQQFPDAHIEVESDLLAAARSLCQRKPGIACILGTGSNNCLYDGKRIIGNIGSLGFWMGDEGSGGYLGKELVINYLHKDLPPDLMTRFAERYPNVERLSILERAYKQPFPNRFFAEFTYFLNEFKTHSFIHALLKKAFTIFLEKYVLKHPNAKNYPVSFVGSVAWVFKDILEEVVTQKGLQLGSVLKSPMKGLTEFHRYSSIEKNS